MSEFKSRKFGTFCFILVFLVGVQLLTLLDITDKIFKIRPDIRNVSVASVLNLDDVTSQTDFRVDEEWFPKQYNKTVLLLVDALRYDFLFRNETLAKVMEAENFDTPPINSRYQNHLTEILDKLDHEKQKSAAFTLIVDPPTLTNVRLAAISTGNFPPTLEFRNGFSARYVLEDNILAELKRFGRKIIFCGDYTWGDMYRDSFYEYYPTDSNTVSDLHSVDKIVQDTLFPSRMKQPNWDIIVGHPAGIDHIGHMHGPEYEFMGPKLDQMNQMIKIITDNLDDDSILIIFGDHGMDPTGNHGGGTFLETRSAFFAYSPNGLAFSSTYPVFSKLQNSGHLAQNFTFSPFSTQRDAFHQIDLVPTLATLQGVPIPHNNVGTLAPETFPKTPLASDALILTAKTLLLNAAQLLRYVEVVDTASEFLSQKSVDRYHSHFNALKSRFIALWDSRERFRTTEEEIVSATGDNLDRNQEYVTLLSDFQAWNDDALSLTEAIYGEFRDKMIMAEASTENLLICLPLLFLFLVWAQIHQFLDNFNRTGGDPYYFFRFPTLRIFLESLIVTTVLYFLKQTTLLSLCLLALFSLSLWRTFSPLGGQSLPATLKRYLFNEPTPTAVLILASQIYIRFAQSYLHSEYYNITFLQTCVMLYFCYKAFQLRIFQLIWPSLVLCGLCVRLSLICDSIYQADLGVEFDVFGNHGVMVYLASGVLFVGQLRVFWWGNGGLRGWIRPGYGVVIQGLNVATFGVAMVYWWLLTGGGVGGMMVKVILPRTVYLLTCGNCGVLVFGVLTKTLIREEKNPRYGQAWVISTGLLISILVWAFTMIIGPDSPIVILLLFLQAGSFIRLVHALRLENNFIVPVYIVTLMIQYFHATGHRQLITGLKNSSAYIGLEAFDIIYCAIIFGINSLNSFFYGMGVIIFTVYAKHFPEFLLTPKAEASSKDCKAQAEEEEKRGSPRKIHFKLERLLFSIFIVMNLLFLATSINASYANTQDLFFPDLFAPKYMFDASFSGVMNIGLVILLVGKYLMRMLY